MSGERKYPDAVFGCGHLGPMGTCGACAMDPNADSARTLAEVSRALRSMARGAPYEPGDLEFLAASVDRIAVRLDSRLESTGKAVDVHNKIRERMLSRKAGR